MIEREKHRVGLGGVDVAVRVQRFLDHLTVFASDDVREHAVARGILSSTFETAMTLPELSRMGEIVSEMSSRRPSFVTRIVS